MRADWLDGAEREYSLNLRAYDTRIGNIGLDLDTFEAIEVTDDKSGYQVSGSVRDAEAGWALTGSLLSDIQFAPTYFDTRIDILDINYQQTFDTGEASQLTLGGGWRSLWYDLQAIDTFVVDFSVQELRQDVFRLYGVHRTYFEGPDVELTLGLAAEHNDFTQFEVQPTVRGSWSPRDNVTLWAAASRAVRTPSIEERLIDSDVFAPLDFQSEVLWAYELGGRSQLSEGVFVDLALFYNDYDELRVDLLQDDFRIGITNEGDGNAYGAELALDLQPTERWTVRSALSLIRSDYNFEEFDLGTDAYFPKRQLNVRSTYRLTDELQFNSAFYAVDGLGEGFEGGEYTRTDIRLGWQPSPGTDVYFGVQNLFDATHSEFLDAQILPRTAILGFSLQF
jgi:iron complex outermembrane recepter protein